MAPWLLTPILLQVFHKGEKRPDRRLRTEEVEYLRAQSENGDAKASLQLAEHTYHGTRGVEKNESDASVAFQKAAETKDPKAMANLGYMLANGWGGMAPDYQKVPACGNAGPYS